VGRAAHGAGRRLRRRPAHGLDTRLGERGTSSQRRPAAADLAGPRLVRKPRLLVLDDATSAVDPEVEARILAALREDAGDGGATLVVVAYRKATIGLADEVLHLADGRVVDRGTHRSCSTAQPAYADLVNAYEVEPAGQSARAVRRGGRMSTTTSERARAPSTPATRSRRSQTIRRGMEISPELREGLGGTLLLAVVATIGQVVVPIAVQQTLDHGLNAPAGPDVGFMVRMGLLAAVAIWLTGSRRTP
jgi:ABC-type sulfate/molybdate transport systems ATPase subunit